MPRLSIVFSLLGLLLPVHAQAFDDLISALADRYADARLLMLGEFHGTEESPAVLRALSRRWLRDDPVTVALEIWRSEQERIDAYLASPGNETDRQALLRGAFWQREPRHSDGRRSEATVQLIEQLRRLRADGLPLTVIAFDDRHTAADDADGHRLLANAIRAVRDQRPDDRLLVLAGNYHARLIPPHAVKDERGQPLPDPPTPTAAHLRDLDPICIQITARRGSFWHHGEPRDLADRPDRATGLLPASPEHDGFHAWLVLPQLTPSPSAVPAKSAEASSREIR